MSNKELFEQAEEFGCQVPIEKAAFESADIPKKVQSELIEAFDTINYYQHDLPEELLVGLRKLGSNALLSVFKKYS